MAEAPRRRSDSRKQRAYFLCAAGCRRMKARRPSAVQAACWLDVKRKYLEQRPELRRVYLTLRDIAPYGPAATKLEFKVLTEATIEDRGEIYHSAMLDLGPASVDGWLARLVASELGVERRRAPRFGRQGTGDRRSARRTDQDRVQRNGVPQPARGRSRIES